MLLILTSLDCIDNLPCAKGQGLAIFNLLVSMSLGTGNACGKELQTVGNSFNSRSGFKAGLARVKPIGLLHLIGKPSQILD